MFLNSRVAVAEDFPHPRTGLSYVGQLGTVQVVMSNNYLVEMDTTDGKDGIRLWFTYNELEVLDHVG